MKGVRGLAVQSTRCIEDLRQEGLKLYEELFVVFRERPADERVQQKGLPESVAGGDLGLPEPHPELPLRVLVALAGGGNFQLWWQTRAFTEWADSEPLHVLFPEGPADVARRIWEGWAPPPPPPPSGPGVMSTTELLQRTAYLAGAVGAEQAEPRHGLAVLLRDAHAELHPLFERLGDNLDELVDRLFPPLESKGDLIPGPAPMRPAFARLVNGQVEVSETTGVPESSWTLLGAFVLDAKISGLDELLPSLEPERFLEVVRGLAVETRPLDEPAQQTVRQPTVRPEARISHDYWTTDDRLGHDVYAEAIASFLRHPQTRAPLTIGIRAPWGAGKTSLMRMVRRRLDPDPASRIDVPRLGVPTRAWWSRLLRSLPLLPERDEPGEVTNGEALRGLGRTDERSEVVAEAAAQCQEKIQEATDGRLPTVWFNAWMYQSDEQVWAGLAQAILQQVTERLHVVQRERFWFELNLRRIDRHALRRRVYQSGFHRALAWGACGAAAGVLAFLGGFDMLSFAVPVFTGAAGFVKTLHDPLREAAIDLVREPAYAKKVGVFSEVREDLEAALDLLATRERPLVVFVDDLDRCSPRVVADVIEGINLFLAGELPNCIFVIAMEPEMVSAHIEVAYEKLVERLAKQDGGTNRNLGWHFLEKIVQLPVSLPAPSEMPAFVDALLGSASQAQSPTAPAPDLEAVNLLASEIREAGRGAGDDEEIRRRLQEKAEQASSSLGLGRPIARQALIKAGGEVYAEQYRDEAQWVRGRVMAHEDDLNRNPREIKRYLNILRLFAFLRFQRGFGEGPSATDEQIGKLACLAIRFPYLLGLLGRECGPDERTLARLERHALGEADYASWAKAVNADEALVDCGQAVKNEALYRLLAKDPPVADVASQYL